MARMEKALSAANRDKVRDQEAFTRAWNFRLFEGISERHFWDLNDVYYCTLDRLIYVIHTLRWRSICPFHVHLKGWLLHFYRIVPHRRLCGKSNTVAKRTLFSTFALQVPH